VEEPKCILLSEISHFEKVVPSMEHSGNGNAVESVERSVVARGLSGGMDTRGILRL
jgi:hypothetical protein